MRAGLVVAAGLLAASSVPVDAVTLRQSGSAFSSGSKDVKKAQLPSECSHCQGTGIVDPFQDTNSYCRENYSQCKCCQEALEKEKARICLTGKQGGSFMGYGSCVAGIKAAMEEKKQQCEHQQAVDDYNKDAEKKRINDMLGDDSPYAHFMVLNKTNATKYAPSRYNSECAAYSEPNCESYKSLCAHGYGCNYVLQMAERELGTVKDYYGMYQNTPCFR